MTFVNIVIFFLVSFCGLCITYYISNKFDLFDYPNKKKIHLVKTANIAGIAFILLFISSIIVYDYLQNELLIIFLCIIVILIGFIDDLKNIKAITKLILISLPVIYFIVNISEVATLGSLLSYNLNLGKFGFFFTFMCMLLLINATNYMDGMDGLISLLAIITFSSIIILLPKSEWNLLTPIICFLIVFLFFNFGILPKQFLGDSGSLGIGFLLSAVSIYYTQENKFIDPTIIIWFLSFYVYEFLTINIIRLKNKKNLFTKDLNFIFNILEKKIGKINTLLSCCSLNIFFIINGYVFNYFMLYDFSILLFIIYFLIYLGLRLKYST